MATFYSLTPCNYFSHSVVCCLKLKNKAIICEYIYSDKLAYLQVNHNYLIYLEECMSSNKRAFFRQYHESKWAHNIQKLFAIQMTIQILDDPTDPDDINTRQQWRSEFWTLEIQTKISCFWMVDHSKSELLVKCSTLDHSKTGHVWFLDPHCIQIPLCQPKFYLKYL